MAGCHCVTAWSPGELAHDANIENIAAQIGRYISRPFIRNSSTRFMGQAREAHNANAINGNHNGTTREQLFGLSLLGFNPPIDTRIKHRQRHSARQQDLVMKCANVECIAEFRLGLGAQFADFQHAEFI